MSHINAWKTEFVGINKPPKVITGAAISFTVDAFWPYANGADDPYWSGGQNPQPYRWVVTFTVDEMYHGSHLTRIPFRFTGNDVEVGDFVAGADDGKVCQVMSILAKDDFTLTAVVQDRLRYNTFRSPVGNGLFTAPGNVIFFQINELGYPMIDPVPGTASSTFADNVLSRFQYMNPLTNYVLVKENNGFKQGDAICIENGEFALSDSNNISKYIGTVVYPGPGPHNFILRPANGIVNFIPGLPGDVGDYIYIGADGSGSLTTNAISGRPVFMKIDHAIPSQTIGTGLDPTGNAGDEFILNGVSIVFANSYTLDDAIVAINNYTATHKILADKVNGATVATSNPADLTYGVIAGNVPFSANINGTNVVFSTTTSGNQTYGAPVSDANDMASDINATEIPDIKASVDQSGNLVITNLVGGSINITNDNPDTSGNPFAGSNSLSGLPLSTAANTTTFVLRLTREDGGPLTIRDLSGTFLSDSGVISGQTGRYALGLNIEQGLRSTSTTMVADIAARNALFPQPGDQAYVLDDGNGEWAIYLWDGTDWNRFSNQRSDATDARTLTLDVDLSTTTGVQSLGHISADRTVIGVRVLVTIPGPSDATVTIGTAGSNNAFAEARDSILSQTGLYSVAPDYRISSYTEIVANVSRPTPGAGNFTIIVTYV